MPYQIVTLRAEELCDESTATAAFQRRNSSNLLQVTRLPLPAIEK